MDLKTQRVTDSAALHIKDAAGKLLYARGKDGKDDITKPCLIYFHGPGTEHAARAETRQSERTLDWLAKHDNKPTPVPPSKRRNDAVEDLVMMTDRFENIEYGDAAGGALFEAVYGDRALGYVMTQAADFLGNWSNFKPASATS